MTSPLVQSGTESVELAPAQAAFLKTILRSGLLERSQLQEAMRQIPAERRAEPETVAEQLVQAGRLTRFQADKLLAGVHLGLVLGPFHVLAPIGRGGMSSVYLARDSRSGQLLALKVLPPRKVREKEQALARFLREMEMSQRVRHPHLTRTLEVGCSRNIYYIAMEFIPGWNLLQLVQKEGPLAVPRAARLFAEVAAGLEHAHGLGLIHRDLKPSNIMVTPADRARLLDLGLALMHDEETPDRTVIGGEGYVIGTMDYLAPEQAANSARIDARADVYGLGCSLYHALAGQPPFPGGTTLDKINRHRTSTPTSLRKLNPAVPPGFAQLIQQMMAKLPGDRPVSATSVRMQLLPWAERLPAAAERSEEDAFTQAVAALQTVGAPAESVGPLIVATVAPGEPESSTPSFQTLFRSGQGRRFVPGRRALVATLALLGLVLLGLTVFLGR